MSGMVFGGVIEAEHQVHRYQIQQQLQAKLAKDKAMWERFEKEYQEEGGPPPPPRPQHLRD